MGQTNIQPTVLIIRGPSGSGKSTTVKRLTSNLSPKDFAICSADSYFTRDGVYTFIQEDLGAAHRNCEGHFVWSIMQKIPLIIVDNCNLLFRDCRFYIENGSCAGYKVKLLEIKTPWARNPIELARRNQHGVSQETLEKMVRKFLPNNHIRAFAMTNLGVEVEDYEEN